MPEPANGAALRAKFSARMLSSFTPTEAREYIAKLEAAVAASPMGLSPGSRWYGPHVDTILVFRDGDLVAGLVVRTVGVLDPLVVTGDLGPLPARFLDNLRQRAEGVLMAQAHEEYLFHVGPEAPAGWVELILKMGGTEDLGAEGIQTFRRKL